jgi:hypothetical protein
LLVGLQLVVLQLMQLAQLAVRQLGPLVVQVHSQVPLVESLRVEMQPVLKLLLVQILEPVEFHLLVHQRQVLWLLLKLELLVSMF